jgi:hypothetical protein
MSSWTRSVQAIQEREVRRSPFPVFLSLTPHFSLLSRAGFVKALLVQRIGIVRMIHVAVFFPNPKLDGWTRPPGEGLGRGRGIDGDLEMPAGWH